MKRRLKWFLIIIFVSVFLLAIIYEYLIYPNTYSVNTALANGDVIVGAGGGNEEKFYQFIENVNKGQSAKIRITAYGKEGDPTIIDINFNGSIIHLSEDATRRYHIQERYKIKGEFTSIISKEHNNIIDYYLTDSSGKYDDEWIYQDQ